MKIYLIFIVLFFNLLALNSCRSTLFLQPCSRIEYTIFTKTPSNKFWYGLPDSIEQYNLKQRDLKQAEKILRKVYHQQMLTRNPEQVFNLEDYRRQYFGYRNDVGERIILIQFILKEFTEDSEYWKQDYFYMDDGCNGVFRIKINLETNKHFQFNINPCS